MSGFYLCLDECKTFCSLIIYNVQYTIFCLTFVLNKPSLSSHWSEKIIFSRQFVDVLNPFISWQQNWR